MEIFVNKIEETVKVLESGGVVVLPTDTVYGLAADAKNEKAVSKVFEIKGRSRAKALPVFVSSFEMLDEIARVQDERTRDFLKKIWPGKITCVFGAKNGGTIAVRIPNYDLILKIVEALARPITGTSANVSGGKEYVKINGLLRELKNFKVQPDFIWDLGDLPPSRPSTVLDCTVWPPKILREGAVGFLDLQKLIPETILE